VLLLGGTKRGRQSWLIFFALLALLVWPSPVKASPQGDNCLRHVDELLSGPSLARYSDLPQPGAFVRHRIPDDLIPWLKSRFYTDRILLAKPEDIATDIDGAALASLLRNSVDQSRFKSSHNVFIAQFSAFVSERVAALKVIPGEAQKLALTLKTTDGATLDPIVLRRRLVVPKLLIQYIAERLPQDAEHAPLIGALNDFLMVDCVPQNYQLWLESVAAGRNNNVGSRESVLRLLGEVSAARSYLALNGGVDSRFRSTIYLAAESSPLSSRASLPPSFDFIIRVKATDPAFEQQLFEQLPGYRFEDGVVFKWVEIKEASSFRSVVDVLRTIRKVIKDKVLKTSVFRDDGAAETMRLVDFHGHRDLIVRLPWNFNESVLWTRGNYLMELDPVGNQTAVQFGLDGRDFTRTHNLFVDLTERAAQIPGIETLSAIIITDLSGAQIAKIENPKLPVLRLANGDVYYFEPTFLTMVRQP
jgi:hypothetical protein